MKDAITQYGLYARVSGLLLLSLLIFGCGGEKKTPPVPVGQMVDYRDEGYRFHISYPQGWISNNEIGQARFFNQEDVDKKFLDPTGAYPNGVMIAVTVTRTKTPTDDHKREMDDMKKNNFQVGPEQAVTVAGVPAVQYTYSANYGAGIKETGTHTFIDADSLLYDIRMAGFADLYDAYKDVFDASLKSFQLPKPVTPGRDETLPAEEMSAGENSYFTFQYPANFNFVNVPKGTYEFVSELRGPNQSTSIRFDIFDAKGLTLEKVVDQNKGKIRTTGSGKSTISGVPAMFLTYNATPTVERRFYFVVNRGKVLRITMDWIKAQSADYQAAYEKVLSSIKFK